MSKVWFVTGSSRGLGRSFVGAALSRGRQPPLRVFFGPQGYQLIQQVYAVRLETWTEWQDRSVDAHGHLGQRDR
jgi:hypothetical protein